MTMPLPLKAALALVLCCALWGLSFPLIRVLMLSGPEVGGTLGWASLLLAARFGFAALPALLFPSRLVPRTWSEWTQGIGLGFFGGTGMLLQADGLAHTLASTSAFLTQGYCLLVPMMVVVRDRRWPSPILWMACLVALGGVAVMSGFDPTTMKMGRGEAETLVGSVFFAFQILWLERDVYRGNDMIRVSWVMFLVAGLVGLPLMDTRTVLPLAGLPGTWVALLVLVLACTWGAFTLMNRWQPELPASIAGVLYCTEPVFTSLYALAMPAVLGSWFGVDYPNEKISRTLLLGGGLILLGNLLLFVRLEWFARVGKRPDGVS
jgi:drug/metabolite transporter (DMT)-like permease